MIKSNLGVQENKNPYCSYIQNQAILTRIEFTERGTHTLQITFLNSILANNMLWGFEAMTFRGTKISYVISVPIG